jgi:hypothetical protein
MLLLKLLKYGLIFSLDENWKYAHFIIIPRRKTSQMEISNRWDGFKAIFNVLGCTIVFSKVSPAGKSKFGIPAFPMFYQYLNILSQFIKNYNFC